MSTLTFERKILLALASAERSLDTVVRAVSAAVLAVLVAFTSLQGGSLFGHCSSCGQVDVQP